MIVMSGRSFSRAMLCAEVVSGTVRLELFDTGLRLISTDYTWMQITWVPSAEWPDAAEPEPDEAPFAARTIFDENWLVRDLMRHVAKLTKDARSSDVMVNVELDVVDDDSLTPTLSPDLTPRRCVIEVPGSVRVRSRIYEAPFVIWQKIGTDWPTEAQATTHTSLTAWMLANLAKIARSAGADKIDVEWAGERRARWSIEKCLLVNPPRGVFMAVRGPDLADAIDDDDDDETTEDETPPLPLDDPPADDSVGDAAEEPPTVEPLVLSPGVIALLTEAARLVVAEKLASVGLLQTSMGIGVDLAHQIIGTLIERKVIAKAEWWADHKVLMSDRQFRRALKAGLFE